MRKSPWIAALCLLGTPASTSLYADEPAFRPTPVPLIHHAPVYVPLAPPRPRPGTREVWRYYGVTQSGTWRPRVILSPHGAYYYYNGEPFPWVTNHSWAFMPYATD